MTEDAQSPSTGALVIEARSGRCLVLTLSRPAQRNALNGALLDALEAALERAAEDSSLIGLVLTGASPAFCAGADLKERLDDPRDRVARMHRLQLVFAELPLLSIAAIDGAAMGGGLELALACDLRITSPTARLGVPEIGMGMFPAYGGTQLLPETIGTAAAIDLILGGEAVDAATAHSMGMVERVSEDPVAAAQAYIARYETRSPAAIRAALQAIRAGKRQRLVAGLPAERDAIGRLIAAGRS